MRHSSWRRRAAVAATAAIASAGLVVPAASADIVDDDGDLVLHYDFSAEGVVTDVSGNGNDGELLGTGGVVADGELTLPGGSSGSGAGHVRLPAGIFDGQDTLTISTWLKNETGNGNYSAMFFGSASNPPAQYWLLNPSNPSGRVKSVFTNSSNPGAPWGTEAGISATNGTPGPLSTDEWAMYTTVITPTSLTGYLNGESMGTVPLERTVSQFGTDLVGYVGRSSYPDMFYAGGVDDVIVSTAAYSAQQVSALYYESERGSAAVAAALQEDADAVSLPGSTTTDLTLPDSGGNGSAITWASSDEAVLGADGRVTRPALGEEDAPITLTATFTLAGVTLEKAYVVTVLAEDPAGDLTRAADAFDLGITVTDGDLVLLGETADGYADLSWESSDAGVIGADGVVTRGEVEQTVFLTATFTSDEAPGEEVERTYEVTVLPQDAGTIASYIKPGDTPRTDVLHLAAKAEAESDYTALNDNKGVRYPTYGLGSSRFGAPEMFRHPDGTFGFLATDNGAGDDVYVYDSADLITYENERLVQLDSEGRTVTDASVRYDNGIGAYRIGYATPSGDFEVTTPDFETFSEPVETELPSEDAVTGLPEGATEASVQPVTQSEYDAVVAKLGRITNTGVSGFDDVTVPVDGELTLPEMVDLSYSDGSGKQLGVDWDTAGVDLSVPGSYEVTGEVRQPVYGDEDRILVEERADPWVLRDNERTGETEYYFTGSYPTTMENRGVGYDRIVLRRAGDINGLTEAEEQVVLYAGNTAGSVAKEEGVRTASSHFRYFWAPEFHKIGDHWVFLFTASTGSGNVWGIRPAIMMADVEDDPMAPASWSEPQFMQSFENDPNAFTHFSLDMTYFEANGNHYVSWSEKPGTSDIRLAQIDPANPQQLLNTSILLSTPEYAWERSGGNIINEGSAVVSDENNVFVFFSAASVDENYSIGVTSAPIDSDLMDPESWTKVGYPLLTTDDFDGQQMGPGHNSFTTDADGNPVIVYHARPPRDQWAPGADGGLDDPSRHARVKTVHFAADGQAVLNQTREEELAPENREISLTVTVEGDDVEPPEASFSDVPEDNMFFAEIEWLASQGISTGWEMPDGSSEFRPLSPINRDAMAAFLYRMAGEPEVTLPETSPFVDVAESNQFYTEIVWLAQEGISTGWTTARGAEFRPLSPIARDAMAAFLYRYDGVEGYAAPTTSPFADVSTSNQFYTEISWMAEQEIAQGWEGNDGTNIFRPLNNVARDAMAAFLYRYAHQG